MVGSTCQAGRKSHRYYVVSIPFSFKSLRPWSFLSVCAVSPHSNGTNSFWMCWSALLRQTMGRISFPDYKVGCASVVAQSPYGPRTCGLDALGSDVLGQDTSRCLVKSGTMENLPWIAEERHRLRSINLFNNLDTSGPQGKPNGRYWGDIPPTVIYKIRRHDLAVPWYGKHSLYSQLAWNSKWSIEAGDNFNQRVSSWASHAQKWLDKGKSGTGHFSSCIGVWAELPSGHIWPVLTLQCGSDMVWWYYGDLYWYREGRDGDRERGLHPVSPDEGLFKNRL